MEHRWSVRRRARSERGALLLLWALSWSGVLVLLLLSYLPLQQTASLAARRSFGEAQALAAAEAGVEMGINRAHGASIPMGILAMKCAVGIFSPDATLMSQINLYPDNKCSALDGVVGQQTYAYNSDGTLTSWALSCGTPPTCEARSDTLIVPDGSGKSAGSYTVTLQPPAAFNGGDGAVRARAPQVVIESVGTSPLITKAVGLRVTLARTDPLFAYAALGGAAIELNGLVLTDSYYYLRHGGGTYGKHYNDCSSGPCNKLSNGHIGTNATSAATNHLDVHGHSAAVVDGAAYVSSGATTRVEPAGQPTGGIKHLARPAPLPTVNVPDTTGWYVPPGGGNLVISSGTQVCDQPTKLTSLQVTGTGVYELQQNCKLVIDGAGGTILQIADSGKIHVNILAAQGVTQPLPPGANGNFQIFLNNGGFDSSSQNGFVNSGNTAGAPDGWPDGYPEDLQIYVTSGAGGHLKQQGSFAGIVYVNGGDLLVETYDASSPFDVYGALIASGTLTLRGDTSFLLAPVRVHWDEALNRIDSFPAPPTLNGTGGSPIWLTPAFRILFWERFDP